METEPQEAVEFFSGAIAKVKALIAKTRADRDMRGQTPQAKLIELRGIVQRGLRVRTFLDSDFWKQDLEPFLRGEASLKPWAPGDPLPIEEVATRHLYNSGKVFIMSRMVSQFGAWVRAGEEASESLKREGGLK